MYKIWVPAWIWAKIVQKMQKLDREGGRGYVINCCRLHYPKAWPGTDPCQGQAHLHGPVQQIFPPSLSSPSNRNQGHWLDCWSGRHPSTWCMFTLVIECIDWWYQVMEWMGCGSQAQANQNHLWIGHRAEWLLWSLCHWSISGCSLAAAL